jgi:hypothetical protein
MSACSGLPHIQDFISKHTKQYKGQLKVGMQQQHQQSSSGAAAAAASAADAHHAAFV